MTQSRADRARAAERTERAIRMRIERKPWREIAETLGYASDDVARKTVEEAYRKRTQQLADTIDTQTAQLIAELDRLAVEAYRQLNMNHVTVSNGQVLREVVDEGAKLAAMDRLLKILDRKAKLLGLDKVIVQSEHKVTIEGIGVEEMP